MLPRRSYEYATSQQGRAFCAQGYLQSGSAGEILDKAQIKTNRNMLDNQDWTRDGVWQF
jgi:hypothetical protein